MRLKGAQVQLLDAYSVTDMQVRINGWLKDSTGVDIEDIKITGRPEKGMLAMIIYHPAGDERAEPHRETPVERAQRQAMRERSQQILEQKGE